MPATHRPKSALNKILAGFRFPLLVLICLTLPFSILLNSALITLFSAVCLLEAILNRRRPTPNLQLLLPIGFYFVHFIGFFNSEVISATLFTLEQKLSLLVFPLAMSASPFSAEQQRAIRKIFIITVGVVCAWTFRNGFAVAWLDERIYDALLVHRPYLGMYCVIAIFFTISEINIQTGRTGKLLLGLLACSFTAFLVVIVAKMAVVALVFVSFGYALFFLLVGRHFKKLVILIVLCGTVLAAAFATSAAVRKAFTKATHFSSFAWDEYNPILVNSLNIRFTLWDCSFHVLRTDHHWLYGAGPEDSQELLNDCYEQRLGKTFFSEQSLNSHNEYLTTWLNTGLVGLLVLVLNLLISLVVAIKRKDSTYFAFLLIIAVSCLTESILSVQKGVVLYSLFNSLFLFKKTE